MVYKHISFRADFLRRSASETSPKKQNVRAAFVQPSTAALLTRQPCLETRINRIIIRIVYHEERPDQWQCITTYSIYTKNRVFNHTLYNINIVVARQWAHKCIENDIARFVHNLHFWVGGSASNFPPIPCAWHNHHIAISLRSTSSSPTIHCCAPVDDCSLCVPSLHAPAHTQNMNRIMCTLNKRRVSHLNSHGKRCKLLVCSQVLKMCWVH